jgi:hypothetical protein
MSSFTWQLAEHDPAATAPFVLASVEGGAQSRAQLIFRSDQPIDALAESLWTDEIASAIDDALAKSPATANLANLRKQLVETESALVFSRQQARQLEERRKALLLSPEPLAAVTEVTECERALSDEANRQRILGERIVAIKALIGDAKKEITAVAKSAVQRSLGKLRAKLSEQREQALAQIADKIGPLLSIAAAADAALESLRMSPADFAQAGVGGTVSQFAERIVQAHLAQGDQHKQPVTLADMEAARFRVVSA